jgi:hypothetical protein
LGTGNSLAANALFSRAAVAAIGAAKRTGVSRLVWMSSFGVGETIKSATLIQKILFGTLTRGVYADKALADDAIRASGLDWTLVHPTALTNARAKGSYRVADERGMTHPSSIARADVAAFMLEAVHSSKWIGRSVVISD